MESMKNLTSWRYRCSTSHKLEGLVRLADGRSGVAEPVRLLSSLLAQSNYSTRDMANPYALDIICVYCELMEDYADLQPRRILASPLRFQLLGRRKRRKRSPSRSCRSCAIKTDSRATRKPILGQYLGSAAVLQRPWLARLLPGSRVHPSSGPLPHCTHPCRIHAR